MRWVVTIYNNNLINYVSIPELVSDFQVDIQKTVLLIIDMQNFSVKPNYGWGPILKEKYSSSASYYFSRLENKVIPNIKKLISFFRNKDLDIIFFTVGSNYKDGSDFLKSRIEAKRNNEIPGICFQGTEEHKIIDELKPNKDEIILNKVSKSAFTSTGINSILRNLGLNTLVITGVHTSSCVDLTARDATELGYKVIIVNDATATFSKKLQKATIYTFRKFFGKVQSTKEIINNLK